jgi:hypothetical protein
MVMRRAPCRRAKATAASNNARPAPLPIAGGSMNSASRSAVSPSVSTHAMPITRSASSTATSTRPAAMSSSLTASAAALSFMNAAS